MQQGAAMKAKDFGLLCKRARDLTRSLGWRRAAGYLRNRDIPFEQAYMILFNRKPKLV